MPNLTDIIKYNNRLEFINEQLEETIRTLKLICEAKESRIKLGQEERKMLRGYIRKLEGENVALNLGRRN